MAVPCGLSVLPAADPQNVNLLDANATRNFIGMSKRCFAARIRLRCFVFSCVLCEIRKTHISVGCCMPRVLVFDLVLFSIGCAIISNVRTFWVSLVVGPCRRVRAGHLSLHMPRPPVVVCGHVRVLFGMRAPTGNVFDRQTLEWFYFGSSEHTRRPRGIPMVQNCNGAVRCAYCDGRSTMCVDDAYAGQTALMAFLDQCLLMTHLFF